MQKIIELMRAEKSLKKVFAGSEVEISENKRKATITSLNMENHTRHAVFQTLSDHLKDVGIGQAVTIELAVKDGVGTLSITHNPSGHLTQLMRAKNELTAVRNKVKLLSAFHKRMEI